MVKPSKSAILQKCQHCSKRKIDLAFYLLIAQLINAIYAVLVEQPHHWNNRPAHNAKYQKQHRRVRTVSLKRIIDSVFQRNQSRAENQRWPLHRPASQIHSVIKGLGDLDTGHNVGYYNYAAHRWKWYNAIDLLTGLRLLTLSTMVTRRAWLAL